MADLGALLARIGPGLFQQAWVVADLQTAEQAMRATLGCGEFVKFSTGDMEYELRGRTVSCALDLGFARSGNVQIELIQPLRGEGVQVEFLEGRGSGPHHLGFLVDELDAVVSVAERAGFVNVMSGHFAGVRLCFIDTFDVLGIYVELLEDPTGMIAAMMPWRD